MRNERSIRREFLLPALLFGCILTLWAIFSVPKSYSGKGDAYDSENEFPALEEIRLSISKRGMWTLRVLREKALKDKVLVETVDPWVKAQIHEGGRTIPAKIRLKGDWTDHLEGNKWSFRVEVDDPFAFRRLRVFNLQHPKTRNYLDEWFFHLVLSQEGILTTRYDFVKLVLNGTNLGVYAIEEHFSKQLLEAQGRREGPIYKFFEEGMWEARVRVMQDTFFPYVQTPLYEAAHPEAFQFNRWLKNDTLRRMHDEGLSLMTQYKDGTHPASEVFDLAQVAVQFALIDVFGGYHSHEWHNRRAYYNPVNQRLEPIVYDAFAGMPADFGSAPFLGYRLNGQTKRETIPGAELETFFFQDTTFLASYYRALWHFSDPKWLDKLLQQFSELYLKREQFLKNEFWGYTFNTGKFRLRCQNIRQVMTDQANLKVEWDSLALTDGNHRYIVENQSPVALRVGGQILSAHDGCRQAPKVEWVGKARPEIGVLGENERFEPVSILLQK